MSGDTTPKPDFEGFARAILEQWPTSDIDSADLFELSVSYGMISEVPGGYDPEHHIDAEGICPERGDPWYEYTFKGEAGPGLYSRQHLTARIRELEAELAALREARGVRVKSLGEGDRAEIIEAAYIAMRRNQRGAKGQTITEWDSIESWVIAETERRILAALEPAPVTPAQAARVLLDEWRHGEGPLGDLACYSMDDDGVMRPDIDGRWTEFPKIEAALFRASVADAGEEG